MVLWLGWKGLGRTVKKGDKKLIMTQGGGANGGSGGGHEGMTVIGTDGKPINLSKEEVLAANNSYLKEGKKLADYEQEAIDEIIKNREKATKLKTDELDSIYSDRDIAFYKYRLSDESRKIVDEGVRNYGTGKILTTTSKKPDKDGFQKVEAEVPSQRYEGLHRTRNFLVVKPQKITGEAIGDYLVTGGKGDFDVIHIPSGMRINSSKKLQEYQRNNNNSSYKFKKVQAREIAKRLNDEGVQLGNNLNSTIKNVRGNPNLVSQIETISDNVAFR